LTDVGSLLEEAVQTGRLDGITIYPSQNWGWQVSIKQKGSEGYVCNMGPDLVTLLAESLASFNRGRASKTPAEEEDIFG
jgi:hypothetical protein